MFTTTKSKITQFFEETAASFERRHAAREDDGDLVAEARAFRPDLLQKVKGLNERLAELDEDRRLTDPSRRRGDSVNSGSVDRQHSQAQREFDKVAAQRLAIRKTLSGLDLVIEMCGQGKSQMWNSHSQKMKELCNV